MFPHLLFSIYGLPRHGSVVSNDFISDHFAAFHHKTNIFQIGNIGDRVSSNSDQIRKLSWLDGADAVLPAQHFGSIDGDGTDHIERRHTGIAQFSYRRDARLAAAFSRTNPAHVRSRRKLHPRLQNSSHQLVVALFAACSRTHTRSADASDITMVGSAIFK